MMNSLFVKFFLFIFFSIFCLCCNSVYTTKERGYAKIELPDHRYRVFDSAGYPYSFEYPVYAKVIPDTTFFGQRPENDFWINMEFPSLNATVFLTYKNIGPNTQSDSVNKKDPIDIKKLIRDNFELSDKNISKAKSIRDSTFFTSNKIYGLFTKIEGDVATSKQFFLTDSVKNYIRGALYFEATPNADSLRPVNDFLQKDIDHIINSFKWKNN